MKALSRKCTAFLLSLTLLLTLAPTALASEALGDDLDLRSTTLNRGAELGEGTFWSNTFSDLRQENYVVYTPNTSVTPIVTYGDYTTATSTVSAAAKRLEEQGLRVVAGINGDYYDTLNGAPLGTVMTGGVLRVASVSNYAVGFRADGTAILGAPALAMQVESANTSFSLAAVNQVRYSYGGRIGVAIEPVTKYLGFTWRTNIALVAGVAAKEAVVSTLGTAYSMGEQDPEDAAPLGERLKQDPDFTPAVALSLMIFILFYSPCFVSLVVIKSEAGGWRWLFFSMIVDTIFAAILAFIAYNIGRFVWGC